MTTLTVYGRSYLRRLAVICTAGLVATTTGCSAVGGTASTRSGPATASPEGSLSLPLDAYDLTGRQHEELNSDRNELLQKCMRGFGLSFTPPSTPSAQYPKNTLILGSLAPLDVAKYGYEGPPGFIDAMFASATGGQAPSFIPQSQEPVYSGSIRIFRGRAVPAGGCSGQVRRAVTHGIPSAESPGHLPASTEYPESIIQILTNQAVQQAQADKRIVALDRAWSTCMRSEGYRYPGPNSAEYGRKWNSPVTRLEIATAVSDERCRQEVRYSPRLQSVIGRYEREIILRYGSILRRARQTAIIELKNARTLLHEPEDIVKHA